MTLNDKFFAQLLETNVFDLSVESDLLEKTNKMFAYLIQYESVSWQLILGDNILYTGSADERAQYEAKWIREKDRLDVLFKRLKEAGFLLQVYDSNSRLYQYQLTPAFRTKLVMEYNGDYWALQNGENRKSLIAAIGNRLKIALEIITLFLAVIAIYVQIEQKDNELHLKVEKLDSLTIVNQNIFERIESILMEKRPFKDTVHVKLVKVKQKK